MRSDHEIGRSGSMRRTSRHCGASRRRRPSSSSPLHRKNPAERCQRLLGSYMTFILCTRALHCGPGFLDHDFRCTTLDHASGCPDRPKRR